MYISLTAPIEKIRQESFEGSIVLALLNSVAVMVIGYCDVLWVSIDMDYLGAVGREKLCEYEIAEKMNQCHLS